MNQIPNIEEMVEEFMRTKGDIKKLRSDLAELITQVYQAGIDEAVEVIKKHSYYAKFGFNTTAETIAVSPPREKRICDTDDTIKALTDNK